MSMALATAASLFTLQPINNKVQAASVSTIKVHNNQINNKVKLTSKSYLEVNDVQFNHLQNDKVAYFTVTVHNQESKSLNLIDYWFNVKSNTGEKYSVQIKGLTEKKDNLIAPNTSRTFKIYTTVNSKLNYSNLSLNVIKWDFSVAGFERLIGTIKVPHNYSNAAPIGKEQYITQGNNKVLTVASALQLVEIGSQTEAMVAMYMTNTSDSTISLANYKYYLRTSGNKYYVLEPDLTDNQIKPGEKKKINYYAKLPKELKKDNYQLFISELEGAESKQELPVAYYKLMLRSAINTITPAGKSGTITVENSSVATNIDHTMIDSNSEYHNITLSLGFKNNSKNPVKLPSYMYYVMTSDGALYPVIVQDTEKELLPNIKAELNLTSSIPADASLNNLKLIVKKSPAESKNNDYLVAQFRIPESKVVTSEDKVTYVNKEGVYEVTVKSFERLPWSNQDIVNATITVKNIGKEMQGMPKLQATAWLNGVKVNTDETFLLNVQNSVGLKPGESSELILTTKVSSDAKFNDAKITLSEVINDKPVATVGNFMIKSEESSIPVYQPGSTAKYTLKQDGTEAELYVLEANTYIGSSQNVIESQLTYQNIGKRFSKLPVLQAYYYTDSGLTIPAEVSVIENEVGPSSQNLISIKANVPKKYEAKDFKLLVGQGIANGKYITGNGTADSYVNAALLAIQEEDKTVNTIFSELNLRPFTFNFNRVSASTNNNDEAQFNFEYSMSEYNPFDYMLRDHKLVLEIEYNGKKFSKAYALGKGNEALSVGDKIQNSFIINDPAMKGVAYTGFHINVYEEVNGAKKLLLKHYIANFG